ncbi:MAG: alpha/beta hydrolase family protein [Nanoarchaeota archaeon]
MIYEEKRVVKPEKDVELEAARHYTDKDAPHLVFVKGLGGSAENREGLMDKLAEDYNVLSFSPRESGRSNGDYRIDSLLDDTLKIFETEAEESGNLPYAIGHSMGGYSLAKILTERKVASKAVLLSPVLDLREQLPEAILSYLRRCSEKGKNPLGFLKEDYQQIISPDFRLCDQKINVERSPEFLESLFSSESCSGKLKVPTKTILTGSSCLYLPISQKELDRLKSEWEKLGSEVEVYGDLDHNFRGKWYFPKGKVFGELEKEDRYKSIKDFLS